ncbi:FABP family protein [Corynebacterium breve]|uniref:Ferric nitrobindin-like protein n=1 Tax=Corynebacterium breve TaxID=3049799 RepID=A0ABY8VJR0_9CORY|nr:FABP family protein [Corynebacterium breve]WIM68463.1 FABP family protein [Corynebacterium breve]
MNLHPNIEPFAFLIGTWVGSGRGKYPTINDFEYRETVTFASTPGKPFLRYEQKTKSPDGAPMHTEVGFLRPVGDLVEFTIAQPTGQTELLEGTIKILEDGSLELLLDEGTVANTATAKPVDGTKRRYVFDADRSKMTTEFEMEASGQAMQNHLISELAISNEV